MKKVFPLLLFAMVATRICTAQMEVGAFLGLSNYAGDLADEKKGYSFEALEYHPAFGLFLRSNVSSHLSVRVQGTYGKITGSDANSLQLSRKRRNLSFRSNIYELALQFEFNLIGRDKTTQNLNSPYVFAGVAGFYFNPQAEYQGKWYDLQPLGTEGQGTTDKPRYRLIDLSIPFGFGFRYGINGVGNLGVEFGLRRTFTDYLDDVSGNYPDIAALTDTDPITASLSYRTPEYFDTTLPNPQGKKRGQATSKDWYLFTGLTLSIDISPEVQKKAYKANY